MTTHTHRTTLHRSLALALVAGAGLSIPACERPSTPSDQVQAASVQGQQGAMKSSDAGELATNLKQSSQSANQAAQSGTSSDQAAAALQQASAALAAGEAASREAVLADHDLRRQLDVLSNLTSAWSQQHALANAAASFDPTQQLRELQAGVEERDRDIRQQRATAAELRQRLDGIEKQIADRRSQADGLTSQAAELAQRASALSAREGTSLVEQSTALRRQGDALRKEAESLTLEVEAVRPLMSEADALVQQFEKQKARLEQSQQSLRDRQAATAREAAAAREAAEVIRGKIDDANIALRTAREAFSSAFDDAAQQFGQASSLAGRAQSDQPQAARVMAGNAHLSLAGLRMTQVQQHDAMASILGLLTSMQPALPDRTALLGQLDEVRTQATKAREDLKGTFEAAKSQFASVQGPAKARFEELTARFESLANPPAPAARMATPEALVAGAIAAAKEARWDDLRAMYLPADTTEGKDLIEMGIRQSEVGRQANDALQAKFGKGLIDVLKASPDTAQMAGMMSMMASGDLAALDPAAVKVRTVGDEKAMFSLPGSPMPIEMVKASGSWKFDGRQMDKLAPMMGPMKPMVDKILGAMQDFVGKVTADEFADETAAAQGFAALMKEAMPPMPGIEGMDDSEPGAE